LVSSVFGKEKGNTWVSLGEFSVDKGDVVGGGVYFKLMVTGISGGSPNLFRLAISPPDVDVFTYSLSLAMPRESGQTSRFYIAVPPGTTRITEHNFDLDGMATSDLQGVSLKGSRNGRWQENEVTIPPSWQLRQRIVYELRKTRTANDNAAVYFTGPQGNRLAIHFSPGAAGK